MLSQNPIYRHPIENGPSEPEAGIFPADNISQDSLYTKSMIVVIPKYFIQTHGSPTASLRTERLNASKAGQPIPTRQYRESPLWRVQDRS